jgi:hydroxyacylglutathione hydrolase
MQIKKKAMGPYQTNCYIVTVNGQDFIIDPGVGASQWVLQNCSNPVAIFNTHGHFDHIWSNSELQKALHVPLYTPKEDVFLLQKSDWMPELPPSTPDIAVNGNETFDFNGVQVSFRHFPGHCPGCSTIEIGDAMFSGDFIFKDSIGRVDFPYSDPLSMKESLKRFAAIEYDKQVYPGHGEATSIKTEQAHIPFWIERI